MEVSIIEAAAALQVSTQTIRRRLTKGLIKGYKRETPQGFVWMVEMADPSKGDTDDSNHANGTALVAELKARIDNLEGQLNIRAGEISELHRLLAAHSLNPAQGKPWWVFWR